MIDARRGTAKNASRRSGIWGGRIITRTISIVTTYIAAKSSTALTIKSLPLNGVGQVQKDSSTTIPD